MGRAFNPNDNLSLVSLAMELTKSGTASRSASEISELIDQLAIDYDSDVLMEHSFIGMTFLEKELEAALGLLADTVLESFVVIVDGNREDLLGALLTNDILVKYCLDILRLRKVLSISLLPIVKLLTDYVITESYALVAYKYRRSSYQLADLMLALAAKRTVQQVAVVRFAAGILTHLVSLPLRKAAVVAL